MHRFACRSNTRKNLYNFLVVFTCISFGLVTKLSAQEKVVPDPITKLPGNPVLNGWYADPEVAILQGRYWIYPTYSDGYEKQVFLDAFSSSNLITWSKHAGIIDTSIIKWAKYAIWAPAIIEHNKSYYLFFSANDIQNDSAVGGIGVAVARSPSGPFRDLLGKPLLGRFQNGAQPIDQFVFKDKDKKIYMIYGGWRHCNIVRLNPGLTGFVPFTNGKTFQEITPAGYVEGPVMFTRKGKYYFMWSEGGWTGPGYRVAYAMSNSVLGPFERIGTVLVQDPMIATGAGHHSVVQKPGSDDWFIVYHRRPFGETDANHRVVCIEKMRFDEKGLIKPLKITVDGVGAVPLR